MIRTAAALSSLLLGTVHWAAQEKRPSYPYKVAVAHEIKPHRRQIPFEGVRAGFNQLRLSFVVSQAGDVSDAKAFGRDELLKFWPQLRAEVLQWKFAPFEEHGQAVSAEIEEYIDLVPPERLPKIHVAPPALRADSTVTITLERSECYGSCAAYKVSVSTDGIVFDGRSFVLAQGRHTDRVDAEEVRKLANKFIAADFYSMDAKYIAAVTDNPGYTLSISVDGHEKEVEDYVGSWVGMPAVISELEADVDSLARTQRWISGDNGLVQALKADRFDFQSNEAQAILKESARRGKAAIVHEFLEAGVPLQPLAGPAPESSAGKTPLQPDGLLSGASAYPEVLKIFIDAGVSKHDQGEKDWALAGAAGSGNLEAVQALIAYGANPNADFSKSTSADETTPLTMEGKHAGSVLIRAAASGNPDMVREILRYHPSLETRRGDGTTAVFAAGESGAGDENGALVECLRLLVQAGADVNARDDKGNTPLHETFRTDVEAELLKLGANVNARNDDGETSIFMKIDYDSIALLLEHAADLTIRNKRGQTVFEAAREKGWEEALRRAVDQFNRR